MAQIHDDLKPFQAVASLPLYKFLSVATRAARAAGKIITAAHGNCSGSVSNKDLNPVDLVTEIDLAVEGVLRAAFLCEFPTATFVSEESVKPGERIEDQLRNGITTILCDPVDGTTNLIHGFPFVCTSIAMLEIGKPVAGVVYNPILDEMYVAAEGCGSWLNGKTQLQVKASPRSPRGFGDLLVIAELGHDRGPASMDAKLESFRAFAAAGAGNVHGLRCTGSAAYNLCLVARGSADAYWEIGIHAWDIAAGLVIVSEAGGQVAGAESFRCYSDAGEMHEPGGMARFDVAGRKIVALGCKDVGMLRAVVHSIVDYAVARD